MTGQVALVTASSKGIGKACALALAESGADIILGLRDINSGKTIVKQIQKMGRDVLPVQMVVTRNADAAEDQWSWRLKAMRVVPEADADHAAGTLNATIHLATAAQTVELGPLFVVNLGQ